MRTEADRLRLRGGFFQFPMITVWLLRGHFYLSGAEWPAWSGPFLLSQAGFLIMAIAMVRIYRPMSGLITSDMFALTRHPMYHGMFMVDVALFFFVQDVTDPVFLGTWALFVGLLLTAGWYQERETLARWGVFAECYYAKTPRFIFEWLWRWPKIVLKIDRI